MQKETFCFTADAVPPPAGAYSHATRWGSTDFLSGQLATDPTTGQLVVGGDLVAEAEQVRRNLEGVLGQFGLPLDDVIAGMPESAA